MSEIFDTPCSIFADAKDNYGRYKIGEAPVTEMPIGDFCLSDRWKPEVLELRRMVELYGVSAAKQREDYRALKARLPGATLSARFERRKVRDERTGREMEVARRTAHMVEHTGFVCIDIDFQDNQLIGDMRQVLRALRHRPEVAFLMRSCSGTGWFALVRIAYPKYHKQQFSALMRDYSAMGINIDKQCGDVTRIRFASYDDNPYVNFGAIPYSGIDLEEQIIAPRAAVLAPWKGTDEVTTGDDAARAERLVAELERHHIDITSTYSDWVRVGYSLATLPGEVGRRLFHRVSAMNETYKPDECDRQYDKLLDPQRISIGTFYKMCADYGITGRK